MAALSGTDRGRALTWVAACCVFVGGAWAQSNVGPNEQRFNAGIYKASHNSYERDETYASQIDNWNCWCLELDLAWHSDTQVRVQHLCTPGSQGAPLANELAHIALSTEAADRVTVVYLEMKDGCDTWPARSTYRGLIRTAVNAAFPGSVYTSLEFKLRDQSRWPSYQELVRRGYHWIIILDEEATGFADDDFFFGMARGNPPSSFEPNSVLINSGDDDEVPNRGNQPDRWLFRAYPLPYCTNPGDDEDYFDDAVANGYTFVATNCIDHHYTMTPTTHSPAPVRVTNGGSGTAFGTLSFPYRFGDGLVQAVLRASPRVPVNIIGGTYFLAAGTRLDRPVILRAAGSAVRLRAQ